MRGREIEMTLGSAEFDAAARDLARVGLMSSAEACDVAREAVERFRLDTTRG